MSPKPKPSSFSLDREFLAAAVLSLFVNVAPFACLNLAYPDILQPHTVVVEPYLVPILGVMVVEFIALVVEALLLLALWTRRSISAGILTGLATSILVLIGIAWLSSLH